VDATMSGEAVCLACFHHWQAVVPIGTPVHDPDPDARCTLECPACSAHKGVMLRFVQYTDIPSWHCEKCNGFLFSAILVKAVPTLACASCGHFLNAIDLFNK
jgi:hypothetical protein